jgi:predicted Zn-dependent protease
LAQFFEGVTQMIGMYKSMILIFAALIFIACSNNKITGRKQLNFISNEEMIAIADTQYFQVLKSSKIVMAGNEAQMVKRIGHRIVAAVQDYYNEMGWSDQLKKYKWEYHLIESKEVNAWCMPGGKIAVYTGLLPITQNENALAVVMGHEVAHALAEHGKERVSQQMLAQGGALTVGLLTAKQSAINRDIFLAAFGAASNYGLILPFSRKQELEADELGLIFSAKAGYDPREAIDLWKRMKKLGGEAKPPEFASTHPGEDTRIKELEKQMPNALAIYEKAKMKTVK